MAYSLLQFVNRVLKRVSLIEGDAGEISSFTDSTRQHDIDVIIQVCNEVIHELYSRGTFPNEVAEGSITLATDTREYSLPSDFEEMAGTNWRTRVLVNASGNRMLYEYPTRDPSGNAYVQMFADQWDPDDWNGTPRYWAISPKANNIRVDSDPSSDDNGDVYKFLYDKRIALTAITDTFPFSDTVVDNILPVVSDLYRAPEGDRTEAIASNAGFKRAVALLTKKKARKQYGPRSSVGARHFVHGFDT